MKIVLPEKVAYILSELNRNGFEGYAVGGCIRDACLGRVPNDWDITTSASPQEVKKIFPFTFDTGIEHGTITVLIDREGFEVTTYRIDGSYEDARHPSEVIFTASLEEDLKRRDFTINAMAYNDDAGLVDLFDGRGDLERGIVRCVGEPRERFSEDALRMMRAVRFCAQLGFELDPDTAAAIGELKDQLSKISAERIQAELVKLVTSDHPEQIRMAWETGITGVVLPEFDRAMAQPQNNAHHVWSVGEHIIETMKAAPADRILRLTMLFHDLGKPEIARLDENGIYHFHGHAAPGSVLAAKIMKRLKFDNEAYYKVKRLVELHSLYPECTPHGVRTAIYRIGEELFPLFLEVKRADILGQNPQVGEKKLEYLEQVKVLYRQILERGDCLSLRNLAVTGKDLIRDGMKPGRELGEVLNELLLDVLETPEHNTVEYLMEKSRQLRA